MRKQGKIVRWSDEKGFGFIIPEEGGDDVFLHIKAFQTRHRRPVDSEVVTYDLATDSDGRLRAEQVLFEGEKFLSSKRVKPATFRLGVVSLFFLFLIAMTVIDRLPKLVVATYTIMSLISFIAYTLDKSAAQNGRWRTKEVTLHLIDLFCGWPGGLLAQNLLRHKTSKTTFQITTWVMIVLNGLILLAIVHPQRNTLLKSAQERLEATRESLLEQAPTQESKERYDDKNHGIQIIPQ